MKFNIDINPAYDVSRPFENTNILLKIEPEVYTSTKPGNYFSFIGNIIISNFPKFLQVVLSDGAWYTIDHYLGIATGSYISEEPSNFFIVLENKCAVVFSLNDTVDQIDKVQFYNLCLRVCNKLLESVVILGLKAKGIVDDAWEQEMRALIPKIEEKIKEVIEKYGDSEE